MGGTLSAEDWISHYRIVGPLGAGGMGEVYVALDTSLERNVALKILPPRLVRNEERVRRFIREAKSASSLNHPNIVTIYEIGHDVVHSAGTTPPADALPVHFISMELIGGVTLSRKLREGQEDLRTLVGYVAQAAEGVAKAHAAGIVHRDLKPGNIMITSDGFAKVLDFGLAKLVERQGEAADGQTSAPTEDAGTGAGVVLGTVWYMSPEQVQGKPADHRSDTFSIGCILYEAATRRRPFIADTDVEVMHQILRDAPPPVEEPNPGVPAKLQRIIHRCLAKDPDRRFQSMKDLAMDLREVVERWDSLPAAGSSTPTVSPAALAAPRTGRRKTAVTVATAALGLAGAALGVYALLGGGGSGAPAARRAETLTLSTLMSRDDLGDAVISGDGRYLAYVTSDGDRSSLMVRQVRTGADVQILPPQEYPIRGISFTPDGDYLYFINRDPALPNYQAAFRVASLGGTPRKVAFDVDSAVTFSPDGKKICFRRGLLQERADSLVILDFETGAERPLMRVEAPDTFFHPGGPGNVAWSPDGRWVAAALFRSAHGARTQVVTIDVATGERRDVGSYTWLFVNGLGWLPDGSSLVISADDMVTQRSQIYRMTYPAGEVSRITSDLDGYEGASTSSDGTLIAAVRRTRIENVWVAPLDAGKEAQPITFATGFAASAELVAPLGDGGIAFTAAQGERTFVWRIEADGSGRKQLTTQGVYVLTLDYTEKAGIVFNRVDADAVPHLWRVDPTGEGQRQFTAGSGEIFVALSPDTGATLFQKFEDPAAVWSADVSGGEPRRVMPRASNQTIEYSPDGSRLHCSNIEMLDGRMYPRHFVIPAEGGEPLASFQLPPGAEGVKFAPGGSAVTYVDRATGFNLMRRPILMEEVEQLSRFDDGRILGHEWSPDGRRIVLHRRAGPQESLWVLEPGGRKPPSVLTAFKMGRIDQYRWARDSRSVVFTYGTVSQDVILIRNFR